MKNLCWKIVNKYFFHCEKRFSINYYWKKLTLRYPKKFIFFSRFDEKSSSGLSSEALIVKLLLLLLSVSYRETTFFLNDMTLITYFSPRPLRSISCNKCPPGTCLILKFEVVVPIGGRRFKKGATHSKERTVAYMKFQNFITDSFQIPLNNYRWYKVSIYLGINYFLHFFIVCILVSNAL